MPPTLAGHVRISKTPGIQGGAACIANTRLAVWGLVEWQRLGWSDETILDHYPQLTPEDLRAAWQHARAYPDEIETAIRENAEA